MTLLELVRRLDAFIKSNPAKLPNVYCIDLSTSKVYLSRAGASYSAPSTNIDCTVTISEANLLELAKNPTAAKVGAMYLVRRISVTNQTVGAKLGAFLQEALKAGA